ncbi:MAG: hypothetical protein K9N46_14320 [Candidatus Marinimicrobia bacterium]|nr:hypothetical protein [Candidatus Neomarinimicrobiota bacterium]MCF7829942.1 hypothetical protein [Candidatus Neomarinimicrobiota bacterium]MCF7881904.1 hypothetical protein [Candidatus Neomarinimicrobiota bacterium]
MLRLILYGVLAYLAYRAFRVVKESFYIEDDFRVDGKEDNKKFDIDEDDIVDAEFKDLKE